MTNWLRTVCDYATFCFSETDILFGYFNNKKDNALIKHILLLGKQLIYQWRPNKFVPNLASLTAKIKYACKIENPPNITKNGRGYYLCQMVKVHYFSIYLTNEIYVVVIINIIKFTVVCNVRKYTCGNLCYVQACKKNVEIKK